MDIYEKENSEICFEFDTIKLDMNYISDYFNRIVKTIEEQIDDELPNKNEKFLNAHGWHKETCHIVSTDIEYAYNYDNGYISEDLLSCGHKVYGNECWTAKYCPECGKRIVEQCI